MLKRLGLRTQRRRGQHFLRRPEAGERIAQAAGVGPEDVVVEIGAGLGNVSVPLARLARRVHAVEPDRRFQPWHTHLAFFFPNLQFHYEDFLKSDAAAWTQDCPAPIAVGNLPYYLTSPILFHLLEGPIRWKRIVVMVQREVAGRMVAPPGGKIYGALSLKTRYFTHPRLLMSMPPGEFHPPPQVHSQVVALEPRPDPLGGDMERRQRVFALIETAFQHRRKTLVNALGQGGWWAPDREALARALEAIGVAPARRPETLALEEFFALEAVLRGAARINQSAKSQTARDA